MHEHTIPLLKTLRIEGFKSIKSATIDLGPVNVFIGPNGGGKSNMLMALRLLGIVGRPGFRLYVGKRGGAARFLHFGPTTTDECEISTEFVDGSSYWGYNARLAYSDGDRLVFSKHQLYYRDDNDDFTTLDLGSGYDECDIDFELKRLSHTRLAPIGSFIDGVCYYHFHDTSTTAPMRQNARQSDTRCLNFDGSNLASWLYWISQSTDDMLATN